MALAGSREDRGRWACCAVAAVGRRREMRMKWQAAVWIRFMASSQRHHSAWSHGAADFSAYSFTAASFRLGEVLLGLIPLRTCGPTCLAAYTFIYRSGCIPLVRGGSGDFRLRWQRLHSARARWQRIFPLKFKYSICVSIIVEQLLYSDSIMLPSQWSSCSGFDHRLS